MQRFLAVGRARLHVLEAGVHDPREAERIVATLDGLRPTRLWLDLAGPEFMAILQGKVVRGLDRRLVAAGAMAGPVEPHAVYRAVHSWAERNGVPVRFLLDDASAPRRLDLWRLDGILRREGFEAGDPTAAARRLHMHYVSRVSGLVAWLDARWTQAARNLARAERDAGAGGIVVCAVPDGEGIADRVQRTTGRR